MKASMTRRLNIVTAAAALALPLQFFISPAFAAEAVASAAPMPAANKALLASQCVSLGAERAISRNSFNRAKPALVNQCDYPVTVSYCVDDSSAGAAACRADDMQKAQRIEAQAAVDLQMRESATLYEKIRWVACRAEPGVTSKLGPQGKGGACVTETSMHAEAEPTRVSR